MQKLVVLPRQHHNLQIWRDLDSWAVRHKSFGVWRRISMLLLTKPASQLAGEVKKGRAFALTVIQTGLRAHEYIECLEALVHDLRNAEPRALAAVARRSDRDELLREAREQPAFEIT